MQLPALASCLAKGLRRSRSVELPNSGVRSLLAGAAVRLGSQVGGSAGECSAWRGNRMGVAGAEQERKNFAVWQVLDVGFRNNFRNPSWIHSDGTPLPEWRPQISIKHKSLGSIAGYRCDPTNQKATAASLWLLIVALIVIVVCLNYLFKFNNLQSYWRKRRDSNPR